MRELRVNSVLIMMGNKIQGILTYSFLWKPLFQIDISCIEYYQWALLEGLLSALSYLLKTHNCPLGIHCSSKDILMRVVAQNLSPELTLVEKVLHLIWFRYSSFWNTIFTFVCILTLVYLGPLLLFFSDLMIFDIYHETAFDQFIYF